MTEEKIFTILFGEETKVREVVHALMLQKCNKIKTCILYKNYTMEIKFTKKEEG